MTVACLQRDRLDDPEEFNVFRIGSRPAAFNEVHAQLVQLLSDTNFVFRRKADILSLRAVAKRRIVNFQSGGSVDGENRDDDRLLRRGGTRRTSL